MVFHYAVLGGKCENLFIQNLSPFQKMFGVCLPKPKVSPSSDSLSSAAATVRKVTHSSPSAGSLFLRLGSVGEWFRTSPHTQSAFSVRSHWSRLLRLLGLSLRTRHQLLGPLHFTGRLCDILHFHPDALHILQLETLDNRVSHGRSYRNDALGRSKPVDVD